LLRSRMVKMYSPAMGWENRGGLGDKLQKH
jgi:hypothetical protein